MKRQVQRCALLAGVAGASLSLVFGVAVQPVSGAPDDTKTSSSSTKEKRVFPVSTASPSSPNNFGVAGPMWASGHHTGQDWGAPTGTPIFSAADGIVVFTGNGGAYGNLTRVLHSGGIETWYAHQSAFATQVGERVRAGQVIGAVGSTGNSTGPHLHFEVRVNGQLSNPLAWLTSGKAVPAPGMPAGGGTLDTAEAQALLAKIVAAEAKVAAAKAEADRANIEVAKVQKRLDKARVKADEAKAVLSGYAREVYKAGADPRFLLQAEALSSGDLAEFTDREVLLAYSNNAQNETVLEALAVIRKAVVLQDKVTAIKKTAEDGLAAANSEAESLIGTIETENDTWSVNSSWDDVVPKGGSEKARNAVLFAVSEVGKKYSKDGGTGPEYDADGLVWRAWNEAGVDWPEMTPAKQATSREYVKKIKPGKEKTGDLIFFTNGKDDKITHVGIVVNRKAGSFAHAANAKNGVELSNYKSGSYSKKLAYFGRMVER